jgi:hypothetical protein
VYFPHIFLISILVSTHPTIHHSNIGVHLRRATKHNIIQIHNNVSWDWQYSMEYSPYSIYMWEFLWILSVPHNVVMDLNNVMNYTQFSSFNPSKSPPPIPKSVDNVNHWYLISSNRWVAFLVLRIPQLIFILKYTIAHFGWNNVHNVGNWVLLPQYTRVTMPRNW